MNKPSQEIEEIINPFIKKWIPEYYAHLVDSDENDGERLRQAISKLIIEARAEGERKWTSGIIAATKPGDTLNGKKIPEPVYLIRMYEDEIVVSKPRKRKANIDKEQL